MQIGEATAALAALSQVTRLRTFRLLSSGDASGLAVGEIARCLEVPQNLMSTHLRILTQAGLLVSRRDGKSIVYSANRTIWEDLVDFMGSRSRVEA